MPLICFVADEGPACEKEVTLIENVPDCLIAPMTVPQIAIYKARQLLTHCCGFDAKYGKRDSGSITPTYNSGKVETAVSSICICYYSCSPMTLPSTSNVPPMTLPNVHLLYLQWLCRPSTSDVPQ